jgi:hypothetical protein
MYMGRLNRLLGDVVISQGGVVPHINPEVSISQLKSNRASITCLFLAAAKQDSEREERESGSVNSGFFCSFFPYCMICIIGCYKIIFLDSVLVFQSGVVSRITS